jgi:gluconate 2-dehydrogenase gamma chain
MDFATIEPVQPNPIITTSVAGSFVAIAPFLFGPLSRAQQWPFFADPVYGGNRDMAAWKMIGFPGARYDYRDWIDRHNERYPHPPISIAGR